VGRKTKRRDARMARRSSMLDAYGFQCTSMRITFNMFACVPVLPVLLVLHLSLSPSLRLSSPSLNLSNSPSLPCALTGIGRGPSSVIRSTPALYVLAQRLRVFGYLQIWLDLPQPIERCERRMTRKKHRGAERTQETEAARDAKNGDSARSSDSARHGDSARKRAGKRTRQQARTSAGESGGETLSLHAVSSSRSNLCTSLS